MINIVLCGGSGSRLWPISRTLMPKQFVKLFDGKSLFQLTVERNSNICDKIFIVSNIEQFFLAENQLDNYPCESDYLLEPVGRNTAPAIALACLALNKDDIVLVTPSDHLIKNEAEYSKVVSKAKSYAEKDYLCTFGITPDYPETGYGYIEADQDNVISFREKPDSSTAEKYVNAGGYYWNSGMFCFKAGVLLDELKKYQPEIYEKCVVAYNKSNKDNGIRVTKNDMLDIPSDSVDYAIMEKSQKVKVVASSIDWSDLGSFDSLYNNVHKDENGNSINTDHINVDSFNNLILGDTRKIATVGIEDSIIVDMADALLVAKRGNSQDVKKIVEKLKAEESELCDIHVTGYRPWGSYTVLEESQGYKIKRIEVAPGGRLSLQKHFHRNEHWIVLSGTATVTVGEKTQFVRPNESIYIKMGEVHRLANEGKIPLKLIEVQVGEYTGEDDIQRLEDDYRRASDA